MLKKIFSIVLVAMLLCLAAIPAAFAADTSTASVGAGNVSFTLDCSKPDYTFTVYKVADYVQSDSNPYGTKYNSLVSDVSSAILNGNQTAYINTVQNTNSAPALLTALDASNLTGATTVGTYNSTTDGASKQFTGLDKGVYYVKATNYPAGVKKVTNSVFALPYYDGTAWVNTIPAINLANKVVEDTVTIKKTITNPTQGNENFTDGGLGDTVNFKLVSDTAGSNDMPLNSYVVTDTMSAGLTYTTKTIAVQLQKEDGTKVKDLAATDYTVTTTGGNGSETVIKVALNPSTVLAANSDFYGADTKKVAITYSATINKYAVTGKAGNPNTATDITYTNKNDVSSTVPGNTVYVYTYTATVNKTDENNTALAGAKFTLYDSTGTTVIGTGTSTSSGLVAFTKTNGDAVKLAPGSYIIRETEAPTGYNRYAEDITVTVNPTYETSYNATTGTWVKTEANEQGTWTSTVKNSKTILPATGGAGEMWIYIVAGIVALAAAGAFVISRRKARASK